MNAQSLLPIGIATLLLSGVTGCTKSDPPQPQAEVTTSTAVEKPRPSMRNQAPTRARIDPQTMKDYRLDLCYYGAFTLRQARESYLGSLGKDEPSEKKLPNFGVSAAPPPGAPGVTSAKAGGPPAPGSSAKAASAASGSPVASAMAAPPPRDRRPADFSMHAPHERNASACSAVLKLTEPAMGDVDVAIAALTPLVVELAKDLTVANGYYAREEYKKDKFAQGKELHKKLLEEFQKLDDLQDKLGKALTGWRQEHPADATKQEEGEKVIASTFESARAVLLGVVGKKIDLAAYKENTAKLEASIGALKEFKASHAEDIWSKIMVDPFEAFLKAAKDAKVSADKGVDADGLLNILNSFTTVIEARYRSVRAALSRSQGSMPTQGPLPPGHPR